MTELTAGQAEIGRAKLAVKDQERSESQANEFTETSFSLRVMESIATAVKENEPLLLGTLRPVSTTIRPRA